jgi:hypothetical protein
MEVLHKHLMCRQVGGESIRRESWMGTNECCVVSVVGGEQGEYEER